MRRFIAHIGAAKTGTTAFQVWLKAHRAEMMRAGFLVPERTRFGNHRAVVMALAGTSDSPNAAAVCAATMQEIDDHPELDIIVSAEALASVEPTSTLLPALTERFKAFDKVAILSVRDPIAHYNSGFAQRRKAMRRADRDWETFLRDSWRHHRGDWRLKVELYEAHGWRILVIPYAAEAKARGITRTILSLPEFGGAADRLPTDKPPERNTSMGAIGLIIMDLIQDAIDPAAVLETVSPPELRERVATLANERFDDQPFNGFTAETRAEVLARFADSNRWIADRFFDVPWEVACPPAPPAPPSPRQLGDLPDRVATRVARTATRMTAYARALGGVERRPRSAGAADDG